MRLNRQLEPVIKQTMSTFADTSLDCDAFYRLVRSGRFSELMRNLFFSLDDRMGNQAYMDRVEEYILRECPTVNFLEARAFLQAVAGFSGYGADPGGLRAVSNDDPEPHHPHPGGPVCP